MKKSALEIAVGKSNCSFNIGTSIIALATISKSAKKRMVELKAIKYLINEEIKKVKPVKKKVLKTKSKRKPTPVNPAFMKLMQPSPELAEIVGSKPLARTHVVSKIWEYIKKNKLQNPKNMRNIICDEKLQKIFKKKEVTMFELAGIVANHLS